jgi:hypothetical protein
MRHILQVRKPALLIIFFILCFEHGWAQISDLPSKETVVGDIVEQVLLFPQEKVYLQTDKPVYLSGEKIWLSAYIVDAVLHKPVSDRYVIAELINPADSVISRIKIRKNEGAFSGHIQLDQRAPRGDYTLCAYTENMLNTVEDTYFKRKIRIESPLSATMVSEVKFRYGQGDRVTAEVVFRDLMTRQKTTPEELRMRINDQPLVEVKAASDTTAYFSFRLPVKNRGRVLFIETKNHSEFIAVPFPRDDYDVSFYPEGGYLMNGVRCVVAFKILNSNGLPESVTGKVFDNTGHECAQMSVLHDGMGLFHLNPEEGMTYYAVCRNEAGIEKRFELPTARNALYSLQVETALNELVVSVIRSPEISDQQVLFLVMHTRGMIHYAESWDHNYGSIVFDPALFPSGVMQIILFDEKLNPLSERLVFCMNDDQAHAEMITDLQNYESRDPVKATLKITDSSGIPLGGKISVSVTDDNDVKPDTTSTIMSALLLTSDLKGNINDPAYYFRERNTEVLHALDLLMLTNGWRRYNLPEVVRGNYTGPQLPVQSGMEISGRLKRLLNDKPVVKGKVTIFSWDGGYFDEAETDSAGSFFFSNIEFPDSTEFILQALNEKGKDYIELLLDEERFALASGLPSAPSSGKVDFREAEHLSGYIARADSRYTIENGMRTIDIEEVIIKGKAPEKKDYSFSYYMPKGSSSATVLNSEQIEEFHPALVSDIFIHIPFTRIENGKVIIERMSYSLNGTVYAVLIIDDIIIHDYDIDMFDPSNIERIGILKGTSASILGGAGFGGAVVITTKRGRFEYINQPKYNIKKTVPLGYQVPVEFYSPRYDTPELRDNGQPDLRTTVYWNPNITVSETGEALFDFYTADAATTYTAVVEGVAADGSLIRVIKKIVRKQART